MIVFECEKVANSGTVATVNTIWSRDKPYFFLSSLQLCIGLNSVPRPNSYPPGTYKCDDIWNQDLCKHNQVKLWLYYITAGPKSSMTVDLKRRKEFGQRQTGRIPGDDRGRNWGDAAASQVALRLLATTRS